MAQTYEFRIQAVGDASQTWILKIGRTIIGRQEGNDIYLKNDRISRQHAEIICSETECRIIDLNSANGTKLNGEKLIPQVSKVVPSGATIEIAEVPLVFESVLIGQPETPSVSKADGAPPSDWEPTKPAAQEDRPYQPPPGLSRFGHRLLQYLPEIYTPRMAALQKTAPATPENFIARLLGLFESILLPLEWDIDNFDLFLHPDTAPREFLPWLASWFGVKFDVTWSESQQRMFLRDAHELYAKRGTSWALRRLLEIYTGEMPEISEPDDAPFTFQVKMAAKYRDKQSLIEAIINANKPADTLYVLEFK